MFHWGGGCHSGTLHRAYSQTQSAFSSHALVTWLKIKAEGHFRSKMPWSVHSQNLSQSTGWSNTYSELHLSVMEVHVSSKPAQSKCKI